MQFLLVVASLFFSFFHRIRALLASVGTARERLSFARPAGVEPSAEEIKAGLGPACWCSRFRQRGSDLLGAQPDGPIPRFLRLSIIPDPDDPFLGGAQGAPEINSPPKVSCSRTTRVMAPRTDHAPAFSEPWAPSTANHHDSCCRVRQSGQQNIKTWLETTPGRPQFLSSMEALQSRCVLFCGGRSGDLDPLGAWPQCRALRRYPQPRLS